MDKNFIIKRLDNYKIINDKNIVGKYKNYNISFLKIKDLISVSIYVKLDNKGAKKLLEYFRTSYSELTSSCANNNFNYVMESCDINKIFDIADEVIEFCVFNYIPTETVKNNFYRKKGKTVRSLDKPNENFIKGIVGAIIGAVPGMILWIFINQYNYSEIISGLIMGIGVVTWYKNHSGYISKYGFVLCFFVQVLMVVLARTIIYSTATKKGFDLQQLGSVFQEIKNTELWLDSRNEAVTAIVSGFVVILFKAIRNC